MVGATHRQGIPAPQKMPPVQERFHAAFATESRMNTSRWALALALLVSPLLLIGGVGEASPRSLSMAWDFGHTILFALLTLGILGPISQRAKASWGLLWATIGVAVALAIAIEWVQGFVGRERSWTDVALSLPGWPSHSPSHRRPRYGFRSNR